MASMTESDVLPVLPLRNSVLFPASTLPVNVGRARSVRLVHGLGAPEGSEIVVVAQRQGETQEPEWKDLFEVGTLAKVLKVVRVGPGSYSLLLQGIARVRIVEPAESEPFMRAKIVRLDEPAPSFQGFYAGVDGLRSAFNELVAMLDEAFDDATRGLADTVQEAGKLADLVTAALPAELLTVGERQAVLDTGDLRERVAAAHVLVRRVIDSLRVRHQVEEMVEREGETQRELVLREQMRAIREELGEGDEEDDLGALRERVLRAGMTDDALKIAKKQLGRMSTMSQQSSEYHVTRAYVELLADLPWTKTSDEGIDVERVKACLEEDQYGLEKVKKRIVEYMAVRKLRGDKRGPILCFAGPPGVGKTTLARSIARAMGRSYTRVALGGVRDEAEIRGHRRTYVGAQPGKVMQAIKKVGVRNPVFLLDEIDKMGSDNHGDPSSALLEVLDPEQNGTFRDHYVDTEFDLSQVVFIATANDLSTVPGPLLDRMEVIQLSGYTRAEKMAIARFYVVPRQLTAHGLSPEELIFTDEGLGTLVDGYTREAGARGLERQVAAICRDVAMARASGDATVVTADAAAVERILGAARYHPELAEKKAAPGVVAGLAWTPAGGDVLFVEASKMPGRGGFKVTGNLRSVMQESAAAAMSFVRSHAKDLALDPEALSKVDVHLHVPKGGTPKDGPSAGVTMFTAVSSLLLGAPVRSDIAMTGEISLRGVVLPVGGIKEKLLAAHRAGMREVLIPARNERDLDELPQDVRDVMKVHLIKRVDEILALVLEAPASRA